MSRLCWWLVDIVSRLLNPGERAVVRGDFAESGETARQALRGVLGLVLRRQAAVWNDWRPWLALVGLVGIAGARLSEALFRFNAAVNQQLMAFRQYGVRSETGLTLREDIFCFVRMALALVSWSWVSGFALGSLSGRGLWLTSAMFYLVVGNFFVARLILHGNITLPGNPSVLSLLIRAMIPFGIGSLFFLAVALWGARKGLQLRTLGMRQAATVAVTVMIVSGLAFWTDGWYEAARESWSGGVWHGDRWHERLLPIGLLNWPLAYMIASSIWQHRRAAVSPESV
jgi:hypothetical protein